MKKLDVITIGAALLDLVGRAERLPAEGEEAFVESLAIEAGGSAANTAVACARLGLSTGFVGAVGRDPLGSMLKQGLEAEGVDVSHVKACDAPTGICSIFLDPLGRRRMYAFSGAANLLSKEDVNTGYVRSARLVHLADLRNVETLTEAARVAREGGARVSLNVGGLVASLGNELARELISMVDVLVLSQDDALKLFASSDPKDVVSKVLGAGVTVAALTLGGDGCILAKGGQWVSSPAFQVNVVDDTGASDSFSAGLAYALLRDLPLERCAEYANAVAALCVSTPGARFRHTLRDVEGLMKATGPRRATSPANAVPRVGSPP